jgi:hypothetical protein
MDIDFAISELRRIEAFVGVKFQFEGNERVVFKIVIESDVWYNNETPSVSGYMVYALLKPLHGGEATKRIPSTELPLHGLH